MKWILLAPAVLLAGALYAQQDATPDKESFVIEPASLAANAQGAALRLASTSPAGFATNSSKPPEIKFSAGVTLVAGSFKLLNSNEAECKVNVSQDAFGAVEVSVLLFSVNGTKTLSTLRGTLGILGPSAIPGSSVTVAVESVPLVRANLATPQAAGVLVLSGPVNGALRVAAPTGARFAAAPVPVISAGVVNAPALAEGGAAFTCVVDNAGGANLTLRLTVVSYDLSLYSQGGGQPGSLACEISGAAISGQSVLAVNAHTGLDTVPGENDNTDVTPPPAPATTPPNTTTNPPRQPAVGASTLPDTTRPTTNPRRPASNNPRAPGAIPRNLPTPRTLTSSSGPAPAPPPPYVPPPYIPPPNRPPAPAPVGGTGGTPVTMGNATARPATAAEMAEHGKPAVVSETKDVMFTTPGLYFCDKDFKPLNAVVLSATVADKASARIWIVLKAARDKDVEKANTVEVKLRVCGTTRVIKLTETGANTGEFRCEKEGIILVSDEEPESVIEEAAEPSAPKPRLPR